MKNLSFFAIAAAALTLAGCQMEKEIDSPSNDLGNSTVIASRELSTKSFLEASGEGETKTYDVYWSVPDQILVTFAGGAPSEFTSTNSEPAQTATFRGTFPKGEGSLYGIYPAESGNAVDAEGNISIQFHAEQTAVEGSYDPLASPAVAVSESKDLTFYNVCGLLALTVGWDDVEKITLEFGIPKPKAKAEAEPEAAGFPGGTLTVAMGEVPEITESSEILDAITLLPPSGETAFSTDKTYYLAVAPCTLPGATFIVSRAEGPEAIIIDKEVKVERAKVHEVPILGPSIDTNGVECVEMAPGFFVATCNVGAENPEDAGDYFAWAETEPKDSYGTWESYKWMTPGETDSYYVTKYTFDDLYHSASWYEYDEESKIYVFVGDDGDGVEHRGLASYDYEDDAARANMGGDWHSPSHFEWEYLISDDFTWEWTGTGYTVTSKVEGCEGNSIFLPAAGYMYSSGLYDDLCGVYWLSSHSPWCSAYAQYGYFKESSYDYIDDESYPYYGFSVRGVCGDIPAKDPYTISDFQSALYFYDDEYFGYTIAFLETGVTSGYESSTKYTDGKWLKIDVPGEIMNMVVDMTENLNGYDWYFYFNSDAFGYYYNSDFKSGSLKVMLDKEAGTIEFEIDAITVDDRPIQGSYSGPIEAVSYYFRIYSETPKTAPKKGPSASIQAGINAPEGSHHPRGARNDRR